MSAIHAHGGCLELSGPAAARQASGTGDLALVRAALDWLSDLPGRPRLSEALGIEVCVLVTVWRLQAAKWS
jgi:hypothetical protein